MALDANLAIFTAGRYHSTITLPTWMAVRREAIAVGLSWPEWLSIPYTAAFNTTYLKVSPDANPGPPTLWSWPDHSHPGWICQDLLRKRDE